MRSASRALPALTTERTILPSRRADFRRRLRWESDGAVVPMKPGNAGGGKDPDIWAFEVGRIA
jgi:hypothetical protein